MWRLCSVAVLGIGGFCLFFAAEAGAHPTSGIVVTPDGEIFFIRTGQGPFKIDTQGNETRLLRDTGGHFMALDIEGRFSSAAENRLFKRVTPPRARPTVLFASGGAPLVVNRDGNLYFGRGYPGGDDMAPGGHTVTRLSPDGKRTLFAPALKTKLEIFHEGVTGLAVGPDGALFVACPNVILKVGMDGAVSEFVHPVVVKDCTDDLAKDSRTRFFH